MSVINFIMLVFHTRTCAMLTLVKYELHPIVYRKIVHPAMINQAEIEPEVMIL